MKEGGKEAYRKFFDAKLKKWGIDSPEDLSDDEKKKFYNEIDKEWNSDDEEGDDGKVKKEYINRDGVRRRCSGGDGRRRSVKSSRAAAIEAEESDCEDDEIEEAKGYTSKQIEKACKKVGMSPAEVGDFYAALDGK